MKSLYRHFIAVCMFLCIYVIFPISGYAVDTGVDSEFPFKITTTSIVTFDFQIGAAGTFYVDWGDGSPIETIVNPTPATVYDKENRIITDGVYVSHTYTTRRAYTIQIGGQATAYSTDVDNGIDEPPAAISFVNNTTVKELDGSLGAVFPTLGDGVTDGTQPRFVDTFFGNSLLALVPATLFDGVWGNASWQFRSTFERCPRLTQIPDGLFRHASGSAPRMFRSTFYNDSGLTNIPVDLFENVRLPAQELFMYTFYGCSNLPSWLPAGILPDNTDGASDMYYSTFTLAGDAQCPPNMYRNMPLGAMWTAPVMCSPCPDNTISAIGSTNIKQCYRACAQNQYFDIDALECLGCPSGSTSDGMITDVSMCKCTAGTYMNTTNKTCLTCPAPYSSSVAGAVNEAQCYLITAPGEYVITPRASPELCPHGKYCPGGAKIYYSDTRYKVVDWIQSDGVAYIDTGMNAHPEYEYTLVTTLGGAAPNTSRTLFGGRTSTSDSAYCGFFTSTNQGTMRYDRFGKNVSINAKAVNFIDDQEFHTLTYAATGEMYVDNARIVSVVPNTSLGKNNIVLFGMNTAGTIDFIDTVNKIASYSVTDTLTGTVLQNMVAMYDTISDEFGMYDTISGTFYTGAGGGQFIGVLPTDDDTRQGIFSCPAGYTDRATTGAIEINDCQIRCSGGYYLPVAYGQCVAVGAGNYSAAHSVNYGNVSLENAKGACQNGLTTVGYGAGADEAGDCGRVLHFGDGVMRVRSEKRTHPSMCFDVGNGLTLYADTVLGCGAGNLCTQWVDGEKYRITNKDLE